MNGFTKKQFATMLLNLSQSVNSQKKMWFLLYPKWAKCKLPLTYLLTL